MRAPALILAGLLAIGGCATVETQVGPSLRPQNLATLELGKSDRAAIVAALGEPAGEGTVQFPGDPEPSAVLSYYRQEDRVELGSSRGESHRGFMLVMLADGLYDGHLWWSTTEGEAGLGATWHPVATPSTGPEPAAEAP